MDYRAAIVSSCWFAVAIISSVYMWVFADKIGDAFGVFIPVGILVLVALIVTVVVINSGAEKNRVLNLNEIRPIPNLTENGFESHSSHKRPHEAYIGSWHEITSKTSGRRTGRD